MLSGAKNRTHLLKDAPGPNSGTGSTQSPGLVVKRVDAAALQALEL
jgi:hypothetical protein